MRTSSLIGTGSGKLGSTVFSVSAGQQIVRAYQPVVANPNTPAQVNQRARMKLASQLAAALAPVIAIQKNGLQSARNLFIKKNFEFISANNGEAMVSYENLQLTNSNAGLPAIAISRVENTGITCSLSSAADDSITRVVYVMYKKTDDAQLQYVGSVIATIAGDNGTFPGLFPYLAGEIVIWAYGMKDLSSAATAKYDDYAINNGTDIATLIGTRSIGTADYKFTRTRGATLAQGESSVEAVPDGSARVYVTASGSGSVSGAGTFSIGSSVTVTATPNSGSTFSGWRLNGSGTYVSTDASYTFTLQQTTDLIAVFSGGDPLGGDSH